MTKEEKDLLVRDLCARLPYGVICHYNCVAEYDTVVIQKANCVNKLEGIIPFNGQIGYMVGGDKVNALSGDIKPYLRPMSSITDEEKEELKDISAKYIDDWENAKTAEEKWKLGAKTSYISAEFYNSHHLDWNGLIEKGLAIAVTEENNPYK